LALFKELNKIERQLKKLFTPIVQEGSFNQPHVYGQTFQFQATVIAILSDTTLDFNTTLNKIKQVVATSPKRQHIWALINNAELRNEVRIRRNLISEINRYSVEDIHLLANKLHNQFSLREINLLSAHQGDEEFQKKINKISNASYEPLLPRGIFSNTDLLKQFLEIANVDMSLSPEEQSRIFKDRISKNIKLYNKIRDSFPEEYSSYFNKKCLNFSTNEIFQLYVELCLNPVLRDSFEKTTVSFKNRKIFDEWLYLQKENPEICIDYTGYFHPQTNIYKDAFTVWKNPDLNEHEVLKLFADKTALPYKILSNPDIPIVDILRTELKDCSRQKLRNRTKSVCESFSYIVERYNYPFLNVNKLTDIVLDYIQKIESAEQILLSELEERKAIEKQSLLEASLVEEKYDIWTNIFSEYLESSTHYLSKFVKENYPEHFDSIKKGKWYIQHVYPDLYQKYSEKQGVYQKQQYAKFISFQENVVTYIRENRYYPPYYEFCKKFHIYNQDNFWKFLLNGFDGVSKSTQNTLKGYYEKTKPQRAFIHLTSAKKETYIIQDYELSDEDKERIFQIIKQEKLPYCVGVYNHLCNEYVKNMEEYTQQVHNQLAR